MINERAYSIYSDSRPMKVAYLMEDSVENLSVIDEIIKRNQECWSGRFSPIILIKAGIISEEQAEFLKVYDPDVVKYSGDIKQNTLQ